MATDESQVDVNDPNPGAAPPNVGADQGTDSSSSADSTDTPAQGTDESSAAAPASDAGAGADSQPQSEDVPASALEGPPDNPGNTGGPTASSDEGASLVGDPQAVAPTTDNTVDGDGNAIIVPSGAAATPSSPPNTLANSGLVAPESDPQGSQDPALTDPVGTARAANEGRTSDPANRIAANATVDEEAGLVAGDSHPDNVPQDISEGDKPSDGGPVNYPFPVQGDVEVALIDPQVYEGEKMEPIYEGDFIVLGEHELVPARLVGAEAAVLDAPTILCNCDWAPRTHEHIHPTAGITVQTRDDTNARLTIPLAAIQRVLRGGRVSR